MFCSEGRNQRLGAVVAFLALLPLLPWAAQDTGPSDGGDGSTAADPGDGPTQHLRHVQSLGGFRGRAHTPIVLSGVPARPRPQPTTSDDD